MRYFDLMQARFSEIDEGFITVQVDGFGRQENASQDVGLPAFEAYHPMGFSARPRDPALDANGDVLIGCTVLRLAEGNADHALVFNDPRTASKLPPLAKGGTMFYGDTGRDILPFASFDGDTGSFLVYVPHASETPTASALSIDVATDGSEAIQLIHGAGMAIRLVAGGKNSIILSNKAGDAYIEINDDGIALNGNGQLVGGLAVGIPTPSAPGPAPRSVALSDEIQAYVAQLTPLLAQIISALNGLAPGSVTGTPPNLAPTVAATKLSSS